MSCNPNWAIQWSRKHSLWHCVYCRAVSKTQDYDAIIHDIRAVKERGNLIQHEPSCKYWKFLERFRK